jgi:hypothetical protein
LVLTDGVTEATNPDEEFFLESRLEACVRAAPGETARQLVERVSRAVEEFTTGAPQRRHHPRGAALLRLGGWQPRGCVMTPSISVTLVNQLSEVKRLSRLVGRSARRRGSGRRLSSA